MSGPSLVEKGICSPAGADYERAHEELAQAANGILGSGGRGGPPGLPPAGGPPGYGPPPGAFGGPPPPGYGGPPRGPPGSYGGPPGGED